ncbi:DUF1156 domain-containing protein [Dehalococcoidia bacterium]|nr:DUF1156 domain-containing protein [Dehalococcoidia bacterium]
MTEKALIEWGLPLKEISAESVREKNIRHGHISTLHIWWARRPLASSRASIYAALTPAPTDEEERLKKWQFITQLCKWENSLNHHVIDKARAEILKACGGKPPKVLDCFAGGGSIPLEALRLGCETHALELNPVAVLILKATLEYPQKFGRAKKMREKAGDLEIEREINPLLEDVKKWGNWVLEEARKEIGRFYPQEPDGSIPVGYIWARTIKCQNPSCGAEIPLMRQFWLAKKDNKQVALKPVINEQGKRVDFKVVQGREIDFDPSEGTTSRATVLCPVCGAGIDGKTVRREAQQGRMGQRMVGIVLHHPQRQGKTYRIATEEDLEVFQEAQAYLEKKRHELFDKWGLDPVPDEAIGPNSVKPRTMWLYGMREWGDLFNPRQKLALITFVDNVRETHQRMQGEGYEDEYATAVATYLALGVDRLADFGSSLCLLNPTGGRGVVHTFGRQAFPMVWDYTESNPFLIEGAGWPTACEKNEKWIRHTSQASSTPAIVAQSSATSLPYGDNYFDAIITDPPYYDNVNYAELSDFFYVWLRRIVGDLNPDLFATPLAPKGEEIVQNPVRHGNDEKAKQFFENMITRAFREIYRVLKPEGIACIVFAHTSTEAWETIINALLKSGLYLTGSYPIHTEMEARVKAKETASLASSIYMVCRKKTREETAYFNEIKGEMEKRVKEKLTQFWNEGISGADFFVSAIGPAVEVFGKYSKVEKLSGEVVSTPELLEYVRQVVSEFALERILKSPDLGGVDAETRFYLLWRWTYNNAKVHFDDARKLALASGTDVTELWDRAGFVKKEKEFVRVLNPQDRARDETFVKKDKFTTIVDALHKAVLYWEKGQKGKLAEFLGESGYGRKEAFWQVAQAISEVLPQGDKEKQLLQGFLYGKQGYMKEQPSAQQPKLL